MGFTLSAQTAASLAGVWENSGRFMEFSASDQARIVLKTYYGFVYEETLQWFPCAVTNEASSDLAGTDIESQIILSSGFSVRNSGSVFHLQLGYPGEKKAEQVSAAVIGNSLYLDFYRRATNGQAALSETQNFPDGFWIAGGNSRTIKIYKNKPVEEFFCYYFTGSSYYRIRFWRTDARYRDIPAQFPAPSGEALSIPKFIRINEDLYTCITSTGTKLRNYEYGTYTIQDGFIVFTPVVGLVGPDSTRQRTISCISSPDGSLFVLGPAYVTRSGISNLDEEIAAHNALRRPPRKPFFEYREPGFYWEEVEWLPIEPTTPPK
ncbi:hypothetical protein K7I13_05005 [Brucepastera parasyntrophica]|uniref:hypothetical protein n=1 Tax=Brucepastera parasyntrophica TaxID=2880008 RepID=UPI00210E3DD9|nr:hypothetical protein [Brucepastera parasyntrophica]ULQ60637.1 hypothetical protein K7I13_05005 [Brucepastera parasyntrophica]